MVWGYRRLAWVRASGAVTRASPTGGSVVDEAECVWTGSEGSGGRRVDTPGSGRGRPRALGALRPLLTAGICYRDKAPGGCPPGGGVGPGRLHEYLAGGGIFRPWSGELRDLALQDHPQPGPGSQSQAAGTALLCRRGAASKRLRRSRARGRGGWLGRRKGALAHPGGAQGSIDPSVLRRTLTARDLPPDRRPFGDDQEPDHGRAQEAPPEPGKPSSGGVTT